MTQTTLSLKDTPQAYGKITRALHWSIAALVAWQFMTMILKVFFGVSPRESAIVGSHGPVGTAVFVLVVIRVIWSVMNAGRRPDHGAGLKRVAVKAGHGILYLVMLIVPLAALLRAFGSGRGFSPFGFQLFPTRETPIAWMVDFGNAVHGELGWVFGVLLLGHIVMVGVHEAMWKDGTMARMAGRRALR
ncbi:cytochrome b [Xinfangfangia sp. D13-10-4-6]|uniref:cytochrome b n=1 Tax=Pseudogemmobacter hezensis TaxID=2737662 RepID=UPI00155730C1|nr:cytochrome b [Pseudogemmobacter hezensis]NPD13834.1 cytochrome b [Pseudogemmobacter hezensis]